jgi:hypothetical protein
MRKKFYPKDKESSYFMTKKAVLRIRNGNQESGIRCLFDPWNRDPGWVKIIRIRIPDTQHCFFGIEQP